jgi:flagellar biosynthesis activator protein FlaF
MQQAANAYARVAKATQSPRELEAAVLITAATRLQAIRDDWAGRRAELFDALTYNRKLWTILVTSATEANSALPQEVKNNIATLAIFIFNRTMAVMTEPAPEKLGALININREIAAGLRAQPQSQPATAA